MFYVRKAHPHEIDFIRNLLLSESLPDSKLEEHITSFMVGELDDKAVAIGGLEIYGNNSLMRGLVVNSDLRNEHLGETTARSLINLADKRNIKFIYTLIDDDNMGYFLAKMRYVPCTREELMAACPASSIPDAKPNAKAWKLDLEKFFSTSCCSEK